MPDPTPYNVHDLDDGLRAGMLDLADVSDLAWWQVVCESIGWDGQGSLNGVTRYRLIRRLLGKMIADRFAPQEYARLLDPHARV